MIQLIYSQKAREDLHGILDYIAKDAPGTAVRFVEELMATCELLYTHPRMGMLVQKISPGLRSLTHGRYVIFYRYHEQENSLRVLRVLHHALDVDNQTLE